MPKKTEANLKAQGNAKHNHGAVAVRQTRILQNMVENGGNSGRKVSISASARVAGYSEAYIKSGKLQKTKAWKELLNDAFPDEKVTSIHAAQLNANKLQQTPFPSHLKDSEIKQILDSQGYTFIASKRRGDTAYVFFSMPDTMARLNALDKVYKLKDRYKNTYMNVGPLSSLSDEEIELQLATIISDFLIENSVPALD